jgi:two-component system, LuxR family, response regulator FixJ
MANNIPIVYIIDDDQEVRFALSLLLESVGLLVEEFASAQQYLDQFNPENSGCLILDVRMPGISGLELQARLQAEDIHPPIIIITGHGDVQMAVRAMQAGAMNFIEKPFNDQDLLDSVYRAIEIDAKERGKALKLADIKERIRLLTPREKEVMDRVAAGKRNKIIADELHISQSTIEAHRKKVMEKMEADSVSALMRMIITMEAENI